MDKYAEANLRDTMLELNTYRAIIRLLWGQKDNATLPERAKLGIDYSIDYIFDMYIECAREEYASIFHKELRETFEEMLESTGRYDSANLSEVDDWRGEYIQDAFNEDFGYDPNKTLGWTDWRIARVPRFKERFINSLKAKWLTREV